MNELILLTDGSVDNQSKVGYGAYLLVTDARLSSPQLKAHVKLQRFEQTSSSKLELQTLLWALGDILPLGCNLTVYTDSQNIIGLPGRRERLEQNDYRAKNRRRLNNDQLYREFFRLNDQLNCKLLKAQGHRPAKQKEEIDRLFSLVDKASRTALRNALQGANPCY